MSWMVLASKHGGLMIWLHQPPAWIGLSLKPLGRTSASMEHEHGHRSKAAIAADFLTLCATGQVRKAYDLYVSESFHHHNAYFPADRESLLLGMEQSAESEPNRSFMVKQTIESDDRVAVYSHCGVRESIWILRSCIFFDSRMARSSKCGI